MTEFLPVLGDLIIIAFDLLLYTQLIPFKKSGPTGKVLLWGGCALIILSYLTATYFWGWVPSVASAVFMTVPSFILFWNLTEYKGCRFVLTFCFVDTLSLMFATFARYISLIAPQGLLLTVELLFSIAVLLLGMPYYKKYHKLLTVKHAGWGSMMITAALIYFALIVFMVYPEPLMNRLEYIPIWLVITLVVLSCYGVILSSIRKTMRIEEQNQQLNNEKLYYNMAFTDSLTGLGNRAAYIQKVNELERSRNGDGSLCCIVLDLNNFKKINDTLGHLVGDEALIATSDAIKRIFRDHTDHPFRMGGDEFFIIVENQEEAAVQEKLHQLRQSLAEQSPQFQGLLSTAVGYEYLPSGQKETIENSFARADKKMYQNKWAQRSQATDYIHQEY